MVLTEYLWAISAELRNKCWKGYLLGWCLTTCPHIDPRGGCTGGQDLQWRCRVQPSLWCRVRASCRGGSWEIRNVVERDFLGKFGLVYLICHYYQKLSLVYLDFWVWGFGWQLACTEGKMKEERGVRCVGFIWAWGSTPQVSTRATGPGKFVGLGHQYVVVPTAHGVPRMGLARASWHPHSQGQGTAQTSALPEAMPVQGWDTLAPAWVEPGGCGWATGSSNSRRAERGPERQGMDFDFWVCVHHCSGHFHCFCFSSGLLLLNLCQRDAGVKGKCGRHCQRKMPPKNGQPSWVWCGAMSASTAA